MAQFARTQRRMLRAAGTRVPIRSMIRLAYEANAISVTLPGGTAFSAVYAATRLRGLGATSVGAGFSLLASGVLSSVMFWTLALAYAGIAGGAPPWLLLLLLTPVVGMILRGRRRRGVGRLVQRSAVRVAALLERRRHDRAARIVRRFAHEFRTVRPSGSDWAVGTVFAALNWLTDLACLAICCVAVSDNTPSLIAILSAYLAGMSASSISMLPGGFGLTEVAMIVAFTANGVGADSATPAVLLYRLISCVLMVAAGWVAWLARRSTPAHVTPCKSERCGV
jgi:hypothetical protein